MSQRDRSLLLLLSACFLSLPAEPLQAQVTPDDSLGKEHSVVRAESARQLIEGGASRGSNLFHSFSEFNVRDHGAVYFAPPEGITNILSRITGNSESSILGTLGVEGTANLFLLNPHGIIFGENANLDLRGSFLATTANSYLFDRELEYSATNPNTPPLLAVNIPLGIQFGSNPATMINRSRFVDSHNVMQGLNISEQKTLSLIGGDVVIEGGYLSTSAGKIEIGAVDSYNIVAITPDRDWTFNYQGVTGFRDIVINNGGKIDGGTVGNSQIALTGRNISLGYDLAEISELGYDIEDFFTLEPLPEIVDLVDDFSQITANNTDNATPSQIAIAASDTFSMIRAEDLLAKTAGMGDAGAINIEADTVIIYDVGFDAGTQENSSGNGGLVTFDANNLSLQKGDGEVGTAGSGNGGTINLNIAEDLKIQFGGFGADTFATGNGGTINLNIAEDLKIQFGGFGADTFAAGNGGTINLSTKNLEVINGGAGVNARGSGNGGTINLKVANEIKVRFGGFGSDTVSTGNGGKIKIAAKTLDLSFAGMGVNARNTGKGGEIEINAETILLDNGTIGAESGQNLEGNDFDVNRLQERFGQKNAGDGGTVKITADNLFLNDEGKITTTSLGTGNAGNINLNVKNLQLQGNELTQIRSSARASGNSGNININSQSIKITESANVTADSSGSGDAGNIFLQATGNIQLQEQGRISVDGGVGGKSGNISLIAKQIQLAQASIISAQASQGDQGNVSLSADSLFLDDSSKITTNATKSATGGNILIDLKDNLVTIDNSRIVSNAVEGQGGNIEIQTRGLFSSFNSKIEASSEFGVNGTVQVNTLDAESGSSLINVPSQLVDPNLYLTKGCGVGSNSSLVNIGRGGFAANLFDVVPNSSTIPDLATASSNLSDPLNNQQLKSPILSLANNNSPANSWTNSQNQKNRVVEAQNWQINQQGKIELVTVASPNNTLPRNSHNCLHQLSS